MNNRKQPTKSGGKSTRSVLPLTGREPFDPPRQHALGLFVAVGWFVTWLGFLIWLASHSV